MNSNQSAVYLSTNQQFLWENSFNTTIPLASNINTNQPRVLTALNTFASLLLHFLPCPLQKTFISLLMHFNKKHQPHTSHMGIHYTTWNFMISFSVWICLTLLQCYPYRCSIWQLDRLCINKDLARYLRVIGAIHKKTSMKSSCSACFGTLEHHTTPICCNHCKS